ncbi:MAG: threonine synthase [Tannerellaceae bacterium]|jgi:threonine synthase|nr:threonine synthase [Tannerellaceae bacterium]
MKYKMTKEAGTGSLLTHLICPECGKEYGRDGIHTVCTEEGCASILSAQYALETSVLRKEDLKEREPSLWRYKELLPVFSSENILNLGEGWTPVVPLPNLSKEYAQGMELLLKDESGNPTGSFKARGLSVAVSKAKELGIKEFVIPTAGNAGGALAAYAARGGLKAHIFMPVQTPAAFKAEARLFGADVTEVDGNISDCGKLAHAGAQANGWFDISTLKEPFRLEGKKTMGYEIAEQLNWTLPDVILYPTGGGTGIVGIWKAFDELQRLGWIGNKRPRMVAVQSDSCNGIYTAFHRKAKHSEYKDNGFTIANGLRVPKPYADKVILRILYDSQGNAVSVSDKEILSALFELAAREGLLFSPEGAALWQACKVLLRAGWIVKGETVLMLNTGSGYKYLDNIE